jgi:hypothetical protein
MKIATTVDCEATIPGVGYRSTENVLPQLKLDFSVDRVILWAKGGSQNDPSTQNFHSTRKSRYRFAAPCEHRHRESVTVFESVRRSARKDGLVARSIGEEVALPKRAIQ